MIILEREMNLILIKLKEETTTVNFVKRKGMKVREITKTFEKHKVEMQR